MSVDFCLFVFCVCFFSRIYRSGLVCFSCAYGCYGPVHDVAGFLFVVLGPVDVPNVADVVTIVNAVMLIYFLLPLLWLLLLYMLLLSSCFRNLQ